MTLERMIGSLSRDEKLAAMGLIWQDLAADTQRSAWLPSVFGSSQQAANCGWPAVPGPRAFSRDGPATENGRGNYWAA
jgi:hypothetical protein